MKNTNQKYLYCQMSDMMKRSHSVQTKKQPSLSCMRCYLLEKQIRFLQTMLQMKQTVQDVSTQTDMEEDDDDDQTIVSEDLLQEEEKDSFPTKVIYEDLQEEEDDVATTNIIRFVRIKTEAKEKDMLFEMPLLETHFIRNFEITKLLSEYDHKYLSLLKLQRFLSLDKDSCVVWKEWNYTKKERDELWDRLYFLYKALQQYHIPFSRTIRVLQTYETKTDRFSHDFERNMRFECKEVL